PALEVPAPTPPPPRAAPPFPLAPPVEEPPVVGAPEVPPVPNGAPPRPALVPPLGAGAPAEPLCPGLPPKAASGSSAAEQAQVEGRRARVSAPSVRRALVRKRTHGFERRVTEAARSPRSSARQRTGPWYPCSPRGGTCIRFRACSREERNRDVCRVARKVSVHALACSLASGGLRQHDTCSVRSAGARRTGKATVQVRKGGAGNRGEKATRWQR